MTQTPHDANTTPRDASRDDSLSIAELDALFAELIAYQQKRVAKFARRIRPNLSDDDILQPHDYPDLYADPAFQFEDGSLAGIRAVEIALRAHLARRDPR